MKARRAASIAAVTLPLLLCPTGSYAEGGGNSYDSPPPVPASAAAANIVLNTLQAGAGGTYLPEAPATITPARHDPINPDRLPPSPNSKLCPPVPITGLPTGTYAGYTLYP